jgi:hypothetical protein
MSNKKITIEDVEKVILVVESIDGSKSPLTAAFKAYMIESLKALLPVKYPLGGIPFTGDEVIIKRKAP